jgi:WXXGXW repeat (2 copies)
MVKMKRMLSFIVIATVIACFASCTATYVVRERPAEVVYVRPAPPSREHIWISGDWVWAGSRYEWREGHWERRREGYRWHEGHWQSSRGGWKWVHGGWDR